MFSIPIRQAYNLHINWTELFSAKCHFNPLVICEYINLCAGLLPNRKSRFIDVFEIWRIPFSTFSFFLPSSNVGSDFSNYWEIFRLEENTQTEGNRRTDKLKDMRNPPLLTSYQKMLFEIKNWKCK